MCLVFGKLYSVMVFLGLWMIFLNVVFDGFVDGGMVMGVWWNVESWEEGIWDI